MRIIAVDAEKCSLKQFTDQLAAAVPAAEVQGFSDPKEALAFARQKDIDVAFMEVEMRGLTGLELARELQRHQPRTNVIFVTGEAGYCVEAFALHASGYILKPARAWDIQRELANLRNPPPKNGADGKLRVQTFGHFEVFYGETRLCFGRSRAKELFAYLIDRRGGFSYHAGNRLHPLGGPGLEPVTVVPD
ncbi:hypothetical protein C4J81_00575 [Deltaproteobacteria bacterium Smac51]|nr:hypothetical protein C4J81_00575 [Deltaproteobacteria bacterium Smac51]